LTVQNAKLEHPVS
jgi:hypothetical protein